MDFILDVTAQGLAYSILAIGVLLTYQILDYADLTVEGSFPLGAAAGATCVMHGINPFLSLIVALITGLAAGYATGLLYVKFGISSFLSGILVMTGLYSINLIVAGDMSNIPLFTYDTILLYRALLGNSVGGALGTWIVRLWPIFVLPVLVLFPKLLMDWFLDMKYGFLMRIAGDNPQLIATLGKGIGHIKMNGLAISNGYVAVSGAVVSQLLKCFDVTLGIGMIAMGLTSVITGLTLFKRLTFIGFTTSVILGAITYQLTIAAALRVGLPPSYLKLIMAIIFIAVLVLGSGVMRKFFHRKVQESQGENMLKLEHIKKTFNRGSTNEVILYRDSNMEIHGGKFVTIIDSSGSGKSMFFNVISRNIRQDARSVFFNGKDVSRLPEHKRSQFIGRVFQDPQEGTSPSLTVLQNMTIAYHKGKSFGLTKGVDKALIPLFGKELADIQLGLESKLHVSVGSLSGGQRQVLSLLMATLITSQLLLLDEHTAALDPKTSDLIIQLTKKTMEGKKMTTIMITHNLKHATTYKDRLLMSHKGEIIMDIPKEEEKQLTVEKLIEKFNSPSMLDALNDELAFSAQ